MLTNMESSSNSFACQGYGIVHPANSATVNNPRDCLMISAVCAWESFVGILVGSIWSAIFLAKLTRISSFAEVTFSATILIRYGTGVGAVEDDDDDADDQSMSSSNREEGHVDGLNSTKAKPKIHRSELSKIPCPVLEFRLLNKLRDQKHGEIIDASLNIATSVDKSQVPSFKKDIAWLRHGKNRKGTWKKPTGLSDEVLSNRREWSLAQNNVQKMLMEHRGRVRRSSIDFDEAEVEVDPTASLVHQRVFAKIYIESQENPFFKRVWLGRHILDENSPLLRPEVKALIKLNNGHWPHILNNPEGVRASVQFDQILVSMSGTSSAECKSVYAQKVYDYEDICVGYKFVNMLYRDNRGCLHVDATLLNDVVEQNGGGGENLLQRNCMDRSTRGQIFIL